MQIKDMSVNELKSLIKETVEEFFADIDAGKEVREEVKQRLITRTYATGIFFS